MGVGGDQGSTEYPGTNSVYVDANPHSMWFSVSCLFMDRIGRILVPPVELWFGLNELIYGKHLKQCLVYGRFSTNISYRYYFYIQCLE